MDTINIIVYFPFHNCPLLALSSQRIIDCVISSFITNTFARLKVGTKPYASCITQRNNITYLEDPIEIIFVETVVRSIRLSERFLLCNFLLAEISLSLSLRFPIFSPISLTSASSASLRSYQKKLGMGIRPGTNFCQSNEVARLSRLFSFPLPRQNCLI